MNYRQMIQETAEVFVILSVELVILFIAISYFVGFLQEKIPPEKIKSMLSSKKGKGYVLAGLLGAITPFCSCSTIPFLKGLLRAKAGFGPMMVFLFSSPLLNPVVIGLMTVTFSFQIAIYYFTMAFAISIIAGYTLEKLNFEKYIKEEAYFEQKSCSANSTKVAPKITNIWLRIWKSTWKDFKQVLPYLTLGVFIGSIIYGFIPSEFIVSIASEKNPFAVPVAAVIGVPLYIRASAVIPLSSALISKGMGAGAVLSLIIGSAGASLTEVILLKAIFKNKMIATFLFVIFSMAILSGYLYYFLFS